MNCYKIKRIGGYPPTGQSSQNCHKTLQSIRYNTGMSSYLYDVSEHQAPALHAAMDDLCAKAGIQKPTLTFVEASKINKPFHRFIWEHMAAAMHVDKPRVIIGEKMRHMMGHYDLNQSISEEFKAILAHEIGHIKHGDVRLWKIVPLRLSPHMGIVAGMAGVWYYEHLKAKAAQEKANGKSESNTQNEIHADWQQSDMHLDASSRFHQHLFSAAKYIAGGLLGFAITVPFYALAHRHLEFRADRVSAELMGSGKPLARALGGLRQQLQQALHTKPEVIADAKKRNPIRQILDTLTHPSDAERIDRLNSWART